MIFGIVGGVGSGKSVSATKKVLDSKPQHCYCNFGINTSNSTRIKKDNVITQEITGKTPRGKDVIEMKVNWEFWNKQKKKHGNYHIFLDECHNLFHSRQSMKKFNVLGTQWISQIRKLLGASETTHIYLMSQKIKRIDSAFRDLMHGVIGCTKYVDTSTIVDTVVVNNGVKSIIKLPRIFILQHYFQGYDCVERAEAWSFTGEKLFNFRTHFYANPYFQFYDTYEIFGETGWL